MATILREDADSFVKTGRYELFPSGRIVNIQHCRDMVHVHCDWPFQVSHVICVQADETDKTKFNLHFTVKHVGKTIMGLKQVLIFSVF